MQKLPPLTPAERKALGLRPVRPDPVMAKPPRYGKPAVAVASGTLLLFILVHVLIGWDHVAGFLGRTLFPTVY